MQTPSTINGDSRSTYRLTIAYYGPAFSGFAWQPSSSKPTVEGRLQEAIRPLTDGRTELKLACAGRTDAGVSALGQLVSFHATLSRCHDSAQLFRAVAAAAPARLGGPDGVGRGLEPAVRRLRRLRGGGLRGEGGAEIAVVAALTKEHCALLLNGRRLALLHHAHLHALGHAARLANEGEHVRLGLQ